MCFDVNRFVVRHTPKLRLNLGLLSSSASRATVAVGFNYCSDATFKKYTLSLRNLEKQRLDERAGQEISRRPSWLKRGRF